MRTFPVCVCFFSIFHTKNIRSINRNASLRVAIEFPNLFFSISFETLFPNQFPHGNQFKCLAVTRLQTKMCWIYSSNQVFMFTENKSNKEIIIWDIWFQRPFRKPKNSIYLLLQHEAFRIEGYMYICMNFFCRKRNGENSRRKVHYVSFGHSMQCRTAFQFLHNRIDNNILCAVFRSKWQHVAFIYFYHHVVYTAIVFQAYSTAQPNSHNNQKKRN